MLESRQELQKSRNGSTSSMGEGGAGETVEICANLIQVAVIFFAHGQMSAELNHEMESISRASRSGRRIILPHQRE